MKMTEMFLGQLAAVMREMAEHTVGDHDVPRLLGKHAIAKAKTPGGHEMFICRLRQRALSGGHRLVEELQQLDARTRRRLRASSCADVQLIVAIHDGMLATSDARVPRVIDFS